MYTKLFVYADLNTKHAAQKTGSFNILIGGRKHWLAQNSTEQEEEKNQ